MTRVNTNPVWELTDQHLVAEYKELPRIFTMVGQAVKRGITPATYGIPEAFTLNAGHMKFFADKLTWLINRYDELVEEMRRRNFTVNFPVPRIPGHITLEWFNDWEPTPQAMDISRRRQYERSYSSKDLPRYYGKCLDRYASMRA